MKTHFPRLLFCALAATVALTQSPAVSLGARPDGQLEIRAVDSQTGVPLPVRIELLLGSGRPANVREVAIGKLGSHFYLQPAATLPLRRGKYTFTLDAGAEYRTQQGRFDIDRHASDVEEVAMRRFANLADEGWWGADLHAVRPGDELPLMAAVEGLHLVANVAWRFDGKKWQATDEKVRRPVAAEDRYVAGRDLRSGAAIFSSPGGDLLLVADRPLDRPPLDLPPGTTSCQCIAAAREAGLRIVAMSPTAWELPLWMATGEIDAVTLLTAQSQWKEAVNADPTGRERDTQFYPGATGLTRWGEHIYHQLLNSGHKVAPLAGSGSGVNDSPLGTNRVYAHLEGEFSSGTWWDAALEGRVVVTNGPLIRPQVGGDPPGTSFLVPSGETVEFEVALNMASRDHVEYLEILKNGEPLHEVRLSDLAAAKGKLPPVPFDEGGWFSIRAATTDNRRYQFAESGPYYVVSEQGPRVSRESVEFFLAWIGELAERPRAQGGCTPDEIEQARAYWSERLTSANAP